MSIDFVKPVFEFGTPPFWDVIGQVRTNIIAAAAREDISLIHTFCYEYEVDDEHFEKLIAAATDSGGEVHLVLLLCDDAERKRRIGNESRVKIGKLTDPESVSRPEKNVVLTKQLTGRETLIIDTTHTPAVTAARRIVQHYAIIERSLGD